MIFEPKAADLDPIDLENALLRAALGDYSDEAAILLLITSGHWLPQLQHAGLITVDGNVDGEGLWAHIAWPDLDGALRIGTIIGRSSDQQVLRAAASIADGHPVDLGDLADGLDRHALTLVLAAIAHAASSHKHHHIARDVGGVPHPGGRLPPLVRRTAHANRRCELRRCRRSSDKGAVTADNAFHGDRDRQIGAMRVLEERIDGSCRWAVVCL